MPEKKETHDVMNDVYMFLGFMAVLIALWYLAGGPGKADLKGLFLAPPAPLGNGQAYGPPFGTDATATPKVEPPPTLNDQNQY